MPGQPAVLLLWPLSWFAPIPHDPSPVFLLMLLFSHACSLQACRDSTVSLAEAEQRVLEFVQQHAPEPGTAQARNGWAARISCSAELSGVSTGWAACFFHSRWMIVALARCATAAQPLLARACNVCSQRQRRRLHLGVA